MDKTSGLTVLPDKENSSQCSGKNWKTTKEGDIQFFPSPFSVSFAYIMSVAGEFVDL